MELLSHSPDETEAIGARLAERGRFLLDHVPFSLTAERRAFAAACHPAYARHFPAALEELRPGDIVQLSFTGDGTFQHSPVVVATGTVPTLENTLIAAHSYDADNRPLSTYTFQDIRFLHVLGTIRP